MIPNLYPAQLITSKPPKLFPNVFIKMPFEPLVTSKALVENKLKEFFYLVQSQVYKMFSENVAEDLLNKLVSVGQHLNYASDKKGIAIFLSTNVEIIYYLNTTVHDEVTVGQPLSVRDIFSREDVLRTYLLLALSSESARFFEGTSDKLTLQAVNLPQQVAASIGYHCTDCISDKRFLQKFVRHADQVLGILSNTYSHPVFMVASPAMKALFCRFSQHAHKIVQYIETPSEDLSEGEILNLLKPFFKNWNHVMGKHMIQQVELAAYNGKLVAGIEEVWKTARQSRCKRLIFEKNFFFPAYFDASGPLPYVQNIGVKESIHIKDAVDDVIENVLRDGGDIEIVEEGVLHDYLHIALIKH